MCIYNLPVFEYLLCERHIAECYFLLRNVIKHILTSGNTQGISGIVVFQISEEEFHWQKMTKEGYFVFLQYCGKRVVYVCMCVCM